MLNSRQTPALSWRNWAGRDCTLSKVQVPRAPRKLLKSGRPTPAFFKLTFRCSMADCINRNDQNCSAVWNKEKQLERFRKKSLASFKLTAPVKSPPIFRRRRALLLRIMFDSPISRLTRRQNCTPAEGTVNVPICLFLDCNCFKQRTSDCWRPALTQPPNTNPPLLRRKSWL